MIALAVQCHLDGAAEAFKSVKLAQDTLLDPEKKAKNDYFVGISGRFRGGGNCGQVW